MIALDVDAREYRTIRDGTQRHVILDGDMLHIGDTVRLDCRDGRTMLVRVTGKRLVWVKAGLKVLVHLEPNADYVRRWEERPTRHVPTRTSC